MSMRAACYETRPTVGGSKNENRVFSEKVENVWSIKYQSVNTRDFPGAADSYIPGNVTCIDLILKIHRHTRENRHKKYVTI